MFAHPIRLILSFQHKGDISCINGIGIEKVSGYPANKSSTTVSDFSDKDDTASLR